MKTIRERINKAGRREVTVELGEGETLMAFHEDRFYKLGGQVDEVMRGHVITETQQVTWCSIGQEWVS